MSMAIGDPGEQRREMPNEARQILQTFKGEWIHSNDCKRTFTKLGFNKGRLPPDLFASIEAYYYNNRDHLAIEEWHKKGGVHVNWYEVPAFMIQMPWELKRFQLIAVCFMLNYNYLLLQNMANETKRARGSLDRGNSARKHGYIWHSKI